ncbi:MAG: hypothetical protein QNJ46_11405 [Leptolyngbyaceae cyanobacterium MO_188.B28]|nr:hypothetical protein [Leptolyngbyaceae cyanobacterium MO_188.B28]
MTPLTRIKHDDYSWNHYRPGFPISSRLCITKSREPTLAVDKGWGIRATIQVSDGMRTYDSAAAVFENYGDSLCCQVREQKGLPLVLYSNSPKK